MPRAERHLAVALLAVVAIAGCATRPKPMLPAFNAADQDVFGGWVVIEMQQPKTPDVAGELIAVGPDRLYVLTRAGGVDVAKADVKKATVTLYDPRTILGNVSGGMLLALTNGVWAGVTIPLWGVAGGIALRDVNIAAEFEYPLSPWESLTKGARFPQGLPDGVIVQNLSARSAPPASP